MSGTMMPMGVGAESDDGEEECRRCALAITALQVIKRNPADAATISKFVLDFIAAEDAADAAEDTAEGEMDD